MFLKRWFLILISILLINSCGESKVSKAFIDPALTPSESVTYAKQIIIEHRPNIILDNYYISGLSYDYIDEMWIVIFFCNEKTEQTEDCYFSTSFNDKSPKDYYIGPES